MEKRLVVMKESHLDIYIFAMQKMIQEHPYSYSALHMPKTYR